MEYIVYLNVKNKVAKKILLKNHLLIQPA